MYKLSRTYSRRKPIAVFDIETDGLGGKFLIGAFDWEGNEGDVEFFADMSDFILGVVLTEWGRQFDWYAHNGAKYDYLYVVSLEVQQDIIDAGFTIEPVLSGRLCRGLKIFKDEHVWRLKDSYCLSFLPLKKFSQTFSPDTVKKDFDFDTQTFDPSNPEHLDYLRMDAKSLLASLLNFEQTMREHFDTSLAWTIAGSAVRAWRSTIDEHNDYVWLSPQADAFIRRAYRGGLCIIRNAIQHDNAHYYDMNSAYAWSMLQGVPVGNAKITDCEIAGADGFYRVNVDTGSSEIPVIGYTTRHGTIYPLGRFTSYATSIEMEFARELGHAIEVLEGFTFPRHDYPFTKFITQCAALRHRDYFGPVGTLAKGLQNNLYGKFGQSREQAYYKLQSDEPDDGSGPWFVESQDTDYRTAEKRIWYQVRPGEREMGMVHWAAWITANVRVRLLRSIIAIGWERFIYCDTDSIVVDGDASDVLDIGKEYGQWKREYGPCTIWPIASKTYLLRTVDEDYEWLYRVRDDEYVVHAKGIPRRLLKADMLLEAFNSGTVPVTFISIASLMRVIKGAEISRNVTRKLSRPESAINAVFNKETRRFEPHRLNMDAERGLQLNIERAIQKTFESESLSWLRSATESLLQGY